MVERSVFGNDPVKGEISLYRITNSSGAYVEIFNLGATLRSIVVPDANGKLGDVLLGPADMGQLMGFAMKSNTIGRCANRIAYGRFKVGEKEIQLETGRGEHSLHSGRGNYANRIFSCEIVGDDSVRMYLHDAGEGGFNGTVESYVTFSFSEDNELRLHYELTPSEETIINPTNHAYFNLTDEGPILDHVCRIAAYGYTPKGAVIGMPEGEIASLEGTPLDFRTPTTFREQIDKYGTSFFEPHARSFDDNFALEGTGFRLIAEVYDPKTGRKLEAYTDTPGVQLFTPVGMNGRGGRGIPDKRGFLNYDYAAFCLETQFFPNAVNCPSYPSPLAPGGETYISDTVYKFSAIK